jgi:hypothetical protein
MKIIKIIMKGSFLKHNLCYSALSPREAAWPARINLSPALVVGDRYLHLLGRGVAAAVGAGDGNCIDASIAATLPLCSKQHMMIIQDNPVWRCMTTSMTKDWFIAGHTECA